MIFCFCVLSVPKKEVLKRTSSLTKSFTVLRKQTESSLNRSNDDEKSEISEYYSPATERTTKTSVSSFYNSPRYLETPRTPQHSPSDIKSIRSSSNSLYGKVMDKYRVNTIIAESRKDLKIEKSTSIMRRSIADSPIFSRSRRASLKMSCIGEVFEENEENTPE